MLCCHNKQFGKGNIMLHILSQLFNGLTPVVDSNNTEYKKSQILKFLFSETEGNTIFRQICLKVFHQMMLDSPSIRSKWGSRKKHGVIDNDRLINSRFINIGIGNIYPSWWVCDNEDSVPRYFHFGRSVTMKIVDLDISKPVVRNNEDSVLSFNMLLTCKEIPTIPIIPTRCFHLSNRQGY